MAPKEAAIKVETVTCPFCGYDDAGIYSPFPAAYGNFYCPACHQMALITDPPDDEAPPTELRHAPVCYWDEPPAPDAILRSSPDGRILRIDGDVRCVGYWH